jgi:hypothetical protein
VTVTFTLHGETYSISRDDVLRVARTAAPDPIAAAGYYVEIEGRQFPPPQVVHLAARTRTRPHSQNSRSILARLGFTPRSAGESPPSNRQPRQTTEGVTSAVLGDWRRKLLRILERLGGRDASLGPAARISRLTENKQVPRTIAAHMRVVLEHRNASEYENAQATGAQAQAVESSWNVVMEWAKTQGIDVPA